MFKIKNGCELSFLFKTLIEKKTRYFRVYDILQEYKLLLSIGIKPY